MKAIVWSKPACGYCVKAKNLLKSKGIEYEEKNIAEGHKIQDLLELVPNAKTMPQIPHWYTRAREWESLHQFAEAVDLINRKGVIEKWGKASYKYYYIDEYKYWTMEEENVPSHKHILINRAKA